MRYPLSSVSLNWESFSLNSNMKAAAAFKPKTATIADSQDPDLLEEKKDIVPVSLYSCDFRLIDKDPTRIH
jgi:hypothetical protein